MKKWAKKQLIETELKMIQMLQLIDRVLKASVISMFKNLMTALAGIALGLSMSL